MRRFLPLVLAASALMPALVAGDAPSPAPMAGGTPPPAVPAADSEPVRPPPANVPSLVKPTLEPKPAAVPEPAPEPVPEANLPEGAFVATMKDNGNVRYGPNRNARVALTMKAGSSIVVLGPAQGSPEWLLVRLPREAKVWMHRKVLTSQDGGKTFVVNEDRAKARDDATLGGNIVCEVDKGEIVETKGRQVGDWYAVMVPSATAYVHRSVLAANAKLPPPPMAQAADRAFMDQLWEATQKRYDAYQAALKKNLDTAAILDWTYLSQQLGEVSAKHPDKQTQAAAQRMQDGIARVVKVVERLQAEHGVTPQKDVPGQPPIPEPAETVARNDIPAVHRKPDPNQVPGDHARPPRPEPQGKGPDAPIAKPKQAFDIQGMVLEQSFPGVGVNQVVVDENQNVQAFLKVKDGSPLQINEYFWRYVGVKGDKVAVDPTKHNLRKDIPLILVEDLVLIKQ